jgi:hypothetical protein
VKKTSRSIAAAVVISMAGVTACFAAELPTYETKGLPISPVQLRVTEAADIEQQAPVPASTLTPLQQMVLTPRSKVKAATVGLGRTEIAGSIR